MTKARSAENIAFYATIDLRPGEWRQEDEPQPQEPKRRILNIIEETPVKGEPFISHGGLFRLGYLIFSIWVCRQFALWLQPIVAHLLGRDY